MDKKQKIWQESVMLEYMLNLKHCDDECMMQIKVKIIRYERIYTIAPL